MSKIINFNISQEYKDIQVEILLKKLQSFKPHEKHDLETYYTNGLMSYNTEEILINGNSYDVILLNDFKSGDNKFRIFIRELNIHENLFTIESNYLPFGSLIAKKIKELESEIYEGIKKHFNK